MRSSRRRRPRSWGSDHLPRGTIVGATQNEHLDLKGARMSHQSHARRASSAYWISRAIILFVYAFAIACIVILAIAFFLQLFNANQTAPNTA